MYAISCAARRFAAHVFRLEECVGTETRSKKLGQRTEGSGEQERSSRARRCNQSGLPGRWTVNRRRVFGVHMHYTVTEYRVKTTALQHNR